MSLHPTPKAGQEAFPHRGAAQNVAGVAAENGRRSKGGLGPNFLSIRRSRKIATGNDCNIIIIKKKEICGGGGLEREGVGRTARE